MDSGFDIYLTVLTTILVITLIKMLWSQLAAPCYSATFWLLWMLLLIRVQTMLNHCQFVFFYHNIEVILSDSLTAWLLCDNYVDMSSIVCAFTVKSNSANQILTLLPIDKKISWQGPPSKISFCNELPSLAYTPPPLQKPTLSKSQIIYLSRLGEFILVVIVCS